MPSALELIRQILLVAGEAALLYIASRLLFVWALESVAGRARWRRFLLGILRGPGNILHEVSHAVGYVVAGYRVRRIVPFFIGREGRGRCQPGRPWSPLALPWLAAGVAGLMPLLTGALVLQGLSWWLGVPADPELLGRVASWREFGDVLVGLDYHAWQTWVFLYLAMSVGAELAPSDVDFRRSLPALVVVTLVGVGLVVAVSSLEPDARLRHDFVIYLGWLMSWVSSVLEFGLMAVVLAMVPALALRPLARRRRRR